MAALHLLGDRLLIKRSSTERKTKGGIILPEGSREKPCSGVVLRGSSSLAFGNDFFSSGLREGVTVLFSSSSGSEIDFEGETFLILSIKDVLGVFLDGSSEF